MPCSPFFFVGSQLFMDRVSPPDVRASAQSLLTLVTLGLGNFLGTLFTARVMSTFTTGMKTNWSVVFSIPCALTVAAALALVALVRDPEYRKP